MATAPELRVDIRSTGTQLTYKRKDGTSRSKGVDLAELVDVLSSNVEHDFGLLPRGLRSFSQKGNKMTAWIEVPGGVRDLQYGNSRPKTTEGCHLPTALFAFHLFKKYDGRLSVGETHLFAIRHPHINLSTDPLFHYPAPNVYPESHRVCWGGALSGLESIKSLGALTSLAQRYFTAPFNQDLFRAGDLSNAFPWSEVRSSGDGSLVENYFKFISEHPFDNSWLRPALPAFSNFGKAVQKLKAGGQ